jgi:aspartate aminotransferase-like enzyme
VNDRCCEKAAKVQNRGWYFDLLLMEKHRLKDSTGMTPVIPLVYALDFQLDRIFAEGSGRALCPSRCDVSARV